MSTRINWHRPRDRVRQRGCEDVHGRDFAFALALLHKKRKKPTRPVFTKAEQREMAARALAEWQARHDH